MTQQEVQDLYNNCPQSKVFGVEMKNIKQDIEEQKILLNDIKALLERVIEDDNKRDKQIARLEVWVKVQWLIMSGLLLGLIGTLLKLFLR